MSSLAAGLIVGFIGSWKLTLIALAMLPVIVITMSIQAGFARKIHEENSKLAKSSKILIESVNNHRTVLGLGAESNFVRAYSKDLDKIGANAKKAAAMSGLLLGIVQLMLYLFIGLLQVLGGHFIENDGLEPLHIFLSLYGVLFAILDTGNALQFMPDIGKAIAASRSIFSYLDQKSEIDIEDKTHAKYSGPIAGKIEFKNVSFKYPSREQWIFKNLNFTVNPGQKVALVGTSGCGKSTIIQLLLRFYDVNEGSILIDGKDIREYDLRSLRRMVGLISQEPVLFDGTIEYNIK